MKKSLDTEFLQQLEDRMGIDRAHFLKRYPGESAERQPVHVVYGGAHLFRANTVRRLGELAVRSLEEYAPDPASFFQAAGASLSTHLQDTVYSRMRSKLLLEPVEDLRIDFEDGYGLRPDDEEDEHAISAARELTQAMHADAVPMFVGIRIKPLHSHARTRALRTLDLFLTEMASLHEGRLPRNFCVTLPKALSPKDVEALATVCARLEKQLGFRGGSLRMEIMIESTQALFNPAGQVNLLPMVAAASGRCVAVHFGPHDYAASRNLMNDRPLTHFVSDFAREVMQVALRSTGVRLADGPTNILPIAPHRPSEGAPLSPQQAEENRSAVHGAWKLHFDNISRSMESGFYQSWDLHPAQLPVRYAAVYAGFLRHFDQAARRLRNFLEAATHATRVGQHFDDYAMAQGLVNYFLQALHCGALTEPEIEEATTLSANDLRSVAATGRFGAAQVKVDAEEKI